MKPLRTFAPLLLLAAVVACDDKTEQPAAEPKAESPAESEPAATAEKADEATEEKKDEAEAKADDSEEADEKKDDAEDEKKDDSETASAKQDDSSGKAAAAKPAAEKEPEKPVKGDEVKGASFATWLQGGSYNVGQQGNVTAVLTAKDPYKCNEKYPYKFKLNAPPDGVSYPSETVRSMSVSAKRSTMSIPFTAAKAGKHTISGTLSFSVCTADKCLVEKRPLAVTVNVK